jgi:hypothetical protein
MSGRSTTSSSSARALCLIVGALLSVGPFVSSAFARMYSCEDAAGRIILRDVPGKRDERNRDAAAAARSPATSPTKVRQIENANPITEAQVQEVVDSMDAARLRGDVPAMLAYVAPDAVFEVEYRLPQGMQFKRFNKDEYAAYLRGGAEFVDGLDFRRESTTILVAPAARQAEITSTLRDTVRVQGETLARVTRSKSLVELREGRPAIILVRAIMRYETPEKANRVGSQQTKGGASGR